MDTTNFPELPSQRGCLVLFSGGQDSTTCLYWAKRHFQQVHALAFDYGQKHAVELEQARLIAELADVSLQFMDISGTLRGSALTEHEQDVSANRDILIGMASRSSSVEAANGRLRCGSFHLCRDNCRR